MPLRRYKFRYCIALIAALLWAQFGAVAHGYSHLRGGAGSGDFTYGHARLCNDCLSFAPLTAAADAPVQAVLRVFFVARAALSVADVAFIQRALRLAYRSRAPPIS